MMRIAATFIAFLLAAITLRVFTAQADAPLAPGEAPLTTPFAVYDATLYRNKPDLSGLGVRPMKVVYSREFWPGKTLGDGLPDEATVRGLAREAALQDEPVCLDIEHWPLRGAGVSVLASLRKYARILDWYHSESPGIRVGYYGTPPIRDYWRAMRDPQSRDYRVWQGENLRLRQLAARADVIYPSLYTFYADRAGWQAYAIAQIREARRYGKPVYVFLWPQYHDSNAFLGGQYLPPDFWRQQLETARKYADGVVIWGGWGEAGPAEWDESAPWWQATREFLAQTVR